MKRFSLLVLFFYCCTFSYPKHLQANPAIGLLLPGVVGAVIFATAGTYYALKKPHSYSSDGHSVTTQAWAYNKVYQSGVTQMIGKPVNAALDLKSAFQDALTATYPKLSAAIRSFFPSNSPKVGDTLSPFDLPLNSNGNVSASCSTLGNFKISSIVGPEYPVTGGGLQPAPTILGCSSTRITFKKLINTQNLWYQQTIYNGTVVPTDKDYNPTTVPAALPENQVGPLSNHIAAAAGSDAAVAADLDQLMKDKPHLWAFPDAISTPANPQSMSDYPPAQPVTGTDINQWAQGQSAAAQQEYIDNLEDLVAANPDNAALKAELERAKAEQAQQESDDVADTFDPISASPFGEAYAPDEFNIPARFTAFLNNVKSSSLFSFSSSFFNSLPGGGSPVYEIEAGQYGHHTINLSQTLSTGLAVLKTVLMLCFGFLSIRVVIMKR